MAVNIKFVKLADRSKGKVVKCLVVYLDQLSLLKIQALPGFLFSCQTTGLVSGFLALGIFKPTPDITDFMPGRDQEEPWHAEFWYP
jgi:hypothetical protein